MIRSMTGFGSAEGEVAGARVAVDVRSVNHRFFNPSIKLPGALQRWEPEAREALRKRVARGHVTLSARIDRGGAAAVGINESRLAAYVDHLRAVQERLGLADSLDLATLLRLPEVVGTGDDGDAALEGGKEAFIQLVDRAASELESMRVAEGERLKSYLLERLGQVEGALDRIAQRAPDRVVEQRDRLREAVRDLLDGNAVDEQRIAQEIAILADRLDVSEEISRFRSHLVAFREALDGGAPDGIGKRLGFLLQEMLREANTTGSKGSDSAILTDVLLIKEELERIREQVENLE